MKRPGVPQTPRSNRPSDRGGSGEPKRAASDSHIRGRGRQAKSEQPKLTFFGKRKQSGSNQSAAGSDTRGTSREERLRRVQERRMQERGEASRELERSRSNDAAGGFSGRLRRYFTPKKASQTFGAHDHTIELDERRHELKAARRKAVAMRAAIGLAIVALLAGLGWTVFFSPLFALSASDVRVTGIDEGTAEVEIQDKLSPLVGTPLPRISMDSVEGSLESIVEVQSASASRAWPKGLNINIVLREPLAFAKEGEGFNVLDRDGIVLRSAPEAPQDLIQVELNTESEQERSKAMGRIATVHAELPPELAERVALYISDALTVELRTIDGRVIKWGDETESKLKAEVALLLLDQRPAQVYDVSTPTRPVTS
ncbi:MAG: FtsQ-type POTRA domain-containing protein [Actinomycetaceae bacterium]|nr:FtsQ-type POTRA domain-containing protein [Actinomycetaceae bacterium]